MNSSNSQESSQKEILESERLRLEIEELKAKSKDKFAPYIPLFSALVAVSGVLIGVYQFNQQQGFNRTQLKYQSDQERETRQEELKKRYWEQQLETYREACNATAAIASSATLEEAKIERKNFWQLYWGRMSLVEHPEVEKAMIDFGKQLKLWEKTKVKPAAINGFSYRVAHCCRKSLQKTWSPVDLGDMKDGACPY